MSVAVGLKPTQSESRHWDIVKGLVLGKMEGGEEEEEEETDGPEGSPMRPSHHPRERSIISHMSRREFPSLSFRTAQPGVAGPDSFTQQLSRLSRRSVGQQQSMSVRSYKQDKCTGRNQAIHTELKPDLWKVVLNSIKTKVCACVFGEGGNA